MVDIVNVAVLAPARTVTLAGAVAAAVLLLERLTTAPPVGAGPFRVTLPVEEVPPITLVGFRVTDKRMAGFTVSEAVRITLL